MKIRQSLLVHTLVFHGRETGSRAREHLDLDNGDSESLFESEEDRAFTMSYLVLRK